MEENKTSVFEKSIDFFAVLRKCWYYVIIAALLFGLLAAAYTTYFVEKTYSSTVKFYVVTDRSTAHYLNTELDAAQTLIDSYSTVLKNNDVFLSDVSAHSGIQYAPSALRSMMTIASMESEAFYVKITNSDSKIAYEIAKTIEQIGPDAMVRFVEAGNVKVLSPAKLSVSPEGPNLMKNVVLATFVGAVLVFALFILLDLFDTRIHTEDDLKRFEIPILGSVPTMPSQSDMKKKARKEVRK
jgi:capsular polysaccharide biosynthesis protein